MKRFGYPVYLLVALLCYLLLYPYPLTALQNDQNVLMVKDTKGRPILHAIVKGPDNFYANANAEGMVFMPDFYEGNEELEIKAMGFETVKFTYQKQAIVILIEKIGNLGEVVVSATRTDRSVEDLPMPVTVINQKQIRETGGMRLSEVLREQTGLQIVSDHGAGIQMQGMSSDYILILLDGEPLIGRTGGTFDLDRLSVSNIEKIEILKGPSSAIYGSEAMAGVINIITKKNLAPKTLNLESRYRSFQTLDLSAEMGLNQNGWNLSGYFNHFTTAGFDLTPDVLGQTGPGFNAQTGQLKVERKLTEKWDLKIFGRYYKEASENVMGVMENANLKPVDMLGNKQELNINPTLSFKPSENMRFTLRGMSSVFSTDMLSRFQEDYSVLDSEDFRQFYHRTEFQGDFSLNEQNLITLGAGHFMETVEATRYEAENRFDAGYLFFQYQWEPTDKWSMVGGLRGDLHSQFGGRLSPKLSGMYRLSDKFSWQTSVGAGFKAPDFRQLLLNFNNAGIGYYVFGSNLVNEGVERLQQLGLVQQILIDPSNFGALEAEKSIAINTGFRWQPVASIMVQGNFFRNDISNLIETAPVARLTSGQNAFSYFNIANVVTQGIELDLNFRITSDLRLAVGYMYLDAKDEDVLKKISNGEIFKRNDQNRTVRVTRSDYGGLFNRSRHSGNFKVNYHESVSQIDVSLRGIYRGPFGFGDRNGNLILDDPSEYAPGITQWNLNLQRSFTNGITVEVGGFNLTNSLNIHDPTNPGRSLYVGLRLPVYNLIHQ
ncbi:TonB-dependent receptor plug domain-containing protein [Anditalea andensis]|uniref:TonB-dependent receptor n=1 Tax=Anditalea andensis TaxID=1048983 RepID=A0A074KX40_9BACT|nr:TonB-dependent receptor [Anditalea andensis]KEO72143.1 TonB-dependent receptor [Anditalea andensis]